MVAAAAMIPIFYCNHNTINIYNSSGFAIRTHRTVSIIYYFFGVALVEGTHESSRAQSEKFEEYIDKYVESIRCECVGTLLPANPFFFILRHFDVCPHMEQRKSETGRWPR